MDRLLEWVVKGFFILIFGPLLLALVIHSLIGLLALVLPWLILLAVVAGVTAGLSAGLVLRRRLPPRAGGTALLPETPPLPHHRVRRPRGGADRR